MENNILRAHVIISGRVQGVFFRMETQRAAKSIGVNGWVKNRMDGKVEAVFEGETQRVERLVEWCRTGPPSADVSKIEIQWESYIGAFETFSITY